MFVASQFVFQTHEKSKRTEKSFWRYVSSNNSTMLKVSLLVDINEIAISLVV